MLIGGGDGAAAAAAGACYEGKGRAHLPMV